MAIRLARTAAASSLVRRLTPENSLFLAGHGGGCKVKRASSSPDKSKKLVDHLSSVIDTINDQKLPLSFVDSETLSETDIINVVEQRIWYSMEEGQFENLPGKGKPLNLNTNPHADPAEDTLYRILSKNGCAPEWVELNKETMTRVFRYNLIVPFGQQMFGLNRLEDECDFEIYASCCIRLGKGNFFFF
ncbi:hypothetical protein UlMin_005678 [Ulmus minor]